MTIRHLKQRSSPTAGTSAPHSREVAVGRRGPQFIKIGGRVVYRLEDVEAYERNQLRASTADDGARMQSSLLGTA